MSERIGNVELNMDFYSGKDLYSDGDIEDLLLDLVKKYGEDELSCAIQEKFQWPVLYHLSKERENIASWYPFNEDASLLEIGAGCGAVTGCLCRSVKSVAAIELSYRRSLINAYRHKNYENLSIFVANFKDIYEMLKSQRYDYITLIGVLEYANSYIEEKEGHLKFLKMLNPLLNENGKIIIAIENRLGMKYFAGCKEDHLGTLFSGIEGYDGNRNAARTFNKSELEQLIKKAGYSRFSFYYPYPDYKFADCIYSDKRLPIKGELTNNIRNFDANRLVLFDESKSFDSLMDSGLFPVFSNSFLVILEKEGSVCGK